MKAPFPYFGGKQKMAPFIASLLPDHRTYIEPFFGSGAVLFAKAPSPHEIVNDLDDGVITFLRVLRDRPEDLERTCRLTPYSRREYETAKLDEDGLDDLERARRFWVLVNQSFAKTSGQRTGWSITTRRTQSVPGSVAGRIGRFYKVAERLARVSFECCDGVDLITRLATPDSVIYVDPPYPGEARNKRHATMTDYRHDMTDEESHRRLAGALLRTPAAVILSGYPTPLYEALFASWDYIDVATTVHSANTGASRSARVERLWSNRPLADGRFPEMSLA